MFFNRRQRFVTVLFALCALLLAQSALAAYVCPGVATTAAVTMASGVPCSQPMSSAIDAEQPGLCHAHCQSERQSAESYQLPQLATLTELGAVLTVAALATERKEPVLRAPLLRPEASPPLAIRYCCFRL